MQKNNYFTQQLDFQNRELRYKNCPYYPCHDAIENQNGQNCLFCYCPLYPCEQKKTGGKFIISQDTKIWDCSNCTFIHQDTIVKNILIMLYEGKTIRYIIQEIFSAYFDKS